MQKPHEWVLHCEQKKKRYLACISEIRLLLKKKEKKKKKKNTVLGTASIPN